MIDRKIEKYIYLLFLRVLFILIDTSTIAFDLLDLKIT